MPPTSQVPSAIDLIPYDAPLSFPEPPKSFTEAHGGQAHNRNAFLTDKDVPQVDLTGKWMIVSGANSGIGREAALKFSRWGANLILACREPGTRTHEAHPLTVVEECQAQAMSSGHDKTTIEWWQLDCADLSSVEALARRWLDTGRPLDILCNNAGMGSSPGGQTEIFLTKDGFEIIHQVNFISHVLLTMMLLPSLAKAKAPRIVCTTSCFHYLGHYNLKNFNGDTSDSGMEGVQYYKNNKLYFQIWLTELQHRLLEHEEYKHIIVNGFHPGFVATGVWMTNRYTLLNWISGIVLYYIALWFGVNAQQGSVGMVYTATSEEAGKSGGRYFNRIWEEESMPHCRDRDARLRVWRKVNDELKLQEKGLLNVLGLYSGEGKS